MKTAIPLFLTATLMMVLFACGEGGSETAGPQQSSRPEQPTGSGQSEETAVQACFEAYQKAILAEDGEVAVTLVDQNTVEYYGRMRDLALTGSRETVEDLSTMDKLMVLSIRHRVPEEMIEAMTAKSLFIHAVDEGWIGRESVRNIGVGDVSVSGNRATGAHLVRGRDSTGRWGFSREDGAWKLDLTSIMPLAEKALQGVVGEMEGGEDEFLLRALELVSERKPDDSVWEPIRK